MNTEPSEYWASLDQYTSFAKDPWGYSRPENRKEQNALSKATFVEWPNTTSDFSLRRGAAPAGKLAACRQSRFITSPLGSDKNSSSSAAPKTTASKKPSYAIADEQLRATVSTDNGCGSADSGSIRTTTAVKTSAPQASPNKTPARHSADKVAAAYTLLQQATAAQRIMASGKINESTRSATAPAPTESPTHQAMAVPRALSQEGHCRLSSLPSHYDWSVKNIGFNDIKSEGRKRMETENRQGYERASSASCDADKPYIAEAANFRFRYPHTLGRIQALSKARRDRVGVRRDRIGANHNRKRSIN
eukprot:g6266.t1